VTTFNRDTVKVEWTEPFDQGSPVTGYKIYFRESDGTAYSLELHDCDGQDPTIFAAKSCSVEVLTLRSAPFSLAWGTSVYANVLAINIYGESVVSSDGNGAVLITYADPPFGLTVDETARTGSSIGFYWSPAEFTGGTDIIDYRITYDGGVGVFIVLEESVTATYYQVTGLTTGEVYVFKVETQNAFGYSEFSEELSILCATVPSQPNTPTTTVTGDEVIFDWSAPVDNGSPIIGYKVYIRDADYAYVIDSSICDGEDFTVITNTQCTVPIVNLSYEPLNLVIGYKIFIRIVAFNAYGDSQMSQPGSGDGMEFLPDPPLNVRNYPTITSDL
jgi:hypothetical protein